MSQESYSADGEQAASERGKGREAGMRRMGGFSLRRACVAGLTALAAILALPVAAQQGYPTKPIRLLVGYPPGGATDIMARAIAQKLGERLGQSVIVENLAGAGGIIASDRLAKAQPDGYTLVFANTSHGVNPSLYKELPYDSVKHFTPVVAIADLTLMLVVNPALPIKSVAELVALAKSKPGQLNFASSGNGQSLHLAGELFKTMAGIDIVHIPYKGSAPARTDLLAGQVQMMFESMIGVLPFVQSGKLRALAVSGAQRSPAAPDVPTLAEAGVPGYEASGWVGILGPAGMPPAVVNRLNSEVNAILKMPDVRTQLASNGADATGGSPEQFAAFIQRELSKWAIVVKASGAKI